MLRDHFKSKLIATKISSSDKNREATLYGQSVIEHAPDHNASAEFRSLASEVISRLAAADGKQDPEPRQVNE